MATLATRLSAAPRAVLYGLSIGWLVIIVKCLTAPMIMEHWHVPVHPGWVIVPTLIFALVVTMLILSHDWQHDED